MQKIRENTLSTFLRVIYDRATCGVNYHWTYIVQHTYEYHYRDIVIAHYNIFMIYCSLTSFTIFYDSIKKWSVRKMIRFLGLSKKRFSYLSKMPPKILSYPTIKSLLHSRAFNLHKNPTINWQISLYTEW